MKILEIFGEPVSNGGQESFLVNALQHMDLTGLQIDVLTPYCCDNEYYRNILTGLKVNLFELNLPFSPGKSRGNIYRPLVLFLKRNQYDVVHIHSGSISILALGSLAARQNKIKKIIVHSHCTGASKKLKYHITKQVTSLILLFCPTDYCACSREAGAWKFPAKTLNKLKILKNGIDLDRFQYSPETREEMRKELGIGPDDYALGHIGRFSYQKNQEFIIDLAGELKIVFPQIRVILIGSGETMQQIKNRVREAGLNDNVLFVGNVNNVQAYLQAMDVFVFPSRFEGLGIVGIEAQAAGLPVIASTNVPEELGVSSLVQFVDLSNKDLWITSLTEARERARQDVREKLRYAGYDIRNTSEQIRKLYLS